jgi:hypothetical protein
MRNSSRFILPTALVVVASGIRLLPYVLHALGMADVREFAGTPWNVSPIGAICLFGGAHLADRRVAYAVPLITLFLSDLGIGLLMNDLAFGLHPMIPAVYGSFLVMVALGTWLRKARGGLGLRLASTVGGALVGEFAFFALTNFANWLFQTDLYPHTPAGLVACYVAAIPFFNKSLVGMAVYGSVLFGGYELISRQAEVKRSVSLGEAR